MPLAIVHNAQTDIGLKRTHNEDRFIADPALGLYVVCDGMGGGNAGEVASAMAIETIRADMATNMKHRELAWIGQSDPSLSAATNRLADAIRFANQVVYDASCGHKAYAGMGTTVVAAYLVDDVLSIAHVGDSRIYLVREGCIQSLTADHSWVGEQVRNGAMTEEEAARSPRKNIVTRALGVEPTVDVECQELPVIAGDRLLLCSDGLTRGVSASDILHTIEEGADVQQTTDRLIALANAAGGEDNTTVLIMTVESGGPSGRWQRFRQWFHAA
jgi:protein phosphatase